ncbi:alpha/beta-hydrolase [Punctularia strigosozonata HHB-11173 SS5]|uniref:alpha/beta-hydrolase n=1 Tax=Punctularia strigosozonata (strain HHB-11173) TaxID=741275 RepID=UPI0004416D7F|nr:alpha/beta-hydrolase [Punctularia strigosozonata HHB-11173 SS5]EIN14592.1 alpha/beta-hydrolase [Punctularia strigosozonata HHB-11173 SS5]
MVQLSLRNVVVGLCVCVAPARGYVVQKGARQSANDLSAPLVDLGYAQYQGSLDPTTNVTSFLGVRYAAPPTGDLRWRAPQTPNATTGIQQATTQPNECFQAATGNSTTDPFRSLTPAKRAVVADEDCLFLNVFSPGPLNASQNLPVLVWIHGGGYIAGAASSFSGEDLIRESGFGIVAVIIQYRLGVFGKCFLPGSEVKSNGVLNAGLLDQNFALQWVQDHIASFGGDPTKVTIWGESAGAGSVLQHIVANGGETDPPLFRGVMTSSTFLPFQYAFNDSIPEESEIRLSAWSCCFDAPDTLACLRQTDVTTLQNLNNAIDLAGFFGVFTWVPVVDGSLIVERPIETLLKGKVNGEALLAVTNTLEGGPFVRASDTTNLTQYVTNLFPLFGPNDIQSVVKLYTSSGFANSDDEAIAIMGEDIFICPTYFLLNTFNGTSFKGEFAIPPASHGDDLPYYFPTSNGPPPFNNSDFLTAFSQSFMSLTRFLDTNVKFTPDIKPDWPVFANGTTEMLFNKTEAGEPLVQTITTSPALLGRCR